MGRRRKRKYSLTPLGYLTVFLILILTVAIILAVRKKDKPHDTESSPSSSQVSSSQLPTDTKPPVIEGAKDITVYVDEPISYRKGVSVTDDTDPNPTLSIDSCAVDTSKAGTYEATYTATDSFGNTAEVKIKVTVGKKPVSSSVSSAASSIDESEVYSLADKKLESLLKEDMTVKQQIKAIYNWANGSVWYSGKSNKNDYLAEAKKVLEGGGTDCFGYFAVTKLMFERLNIPNIDVKKIKNYEGDSNHYWSLVSIDGGQTYYHFDATPRKGDGDYFFLVTDAELDAYSDKHGKSHNRDKSLYPATPEE